eukprot:CAMPEP_0201522688 /NCGR_PEP_ID=MMETSP0161_2-20130828/18496_1 /ASSEMBLY_ACC=CAM_ASM_000251 /TAXON_ID=180227 /ORGANISM="Neoparamoeba aestuarina, Strain SoJaBio B1-5/56/2" /LENGTH=48 /DNA_ID= /DNA_START= /DNA_END= /DNA_ORIENTATION=
MEKCSERKQQSEKKLKKGYNEKKKEKFMELNKKGQETNKNEEQAKQQE